MLTDILKIRQSQGKQYIPDVHSVMLSSFRGKPKFTNTPCTNGCKACVDICPSEAITLEPMKIDLGRCVFCNECTLACPVEKISFSPEHRMSSDTREGLVLSETKPDLSPVKVNTHIQKIFGRSLKLRSVSAGGCNGCELELNALTNVNFDISRFGIDFVASPRHADALVLSGPITQNMQEALKLTWEAMPDPKFVIAVGACAISGGVFARSEAVQRGFLDTHIPALFVPGCPPHPLTFISGILQMLGS